MHVALDVCFSFACCAAWGSFLSAQEKNMGKKLYDHYSLNIGIIDQNVQTVKLFNYIGGWVGRWEGCWVVGLETKLVNEIDIFSP